MPVQFGLYPGSACGDDASGIVSGRPDSAAAIHRALDTLEHGTSARLLVRSYAKFDDVRGPDATDI
ncbi:MAG TPA: hypothetical protein VKB34_20840, partial [Povalibacter sp.]|nr:hypothetical protein [Povalibacter sp.]